WRSLCPGQPSGPAPCKHPGLACSGWPRPRGRPARVESRRNAPRRDPGRASSQASLLSWPTDSPRLPLVGRYTLCEAERLQALQPAFGLYALDVVLPLVALDRLAGQEHAAGAEQRVEVSVHPPVHGRLRSLDGLVETDLILRLHRIAHVVPGEPGEK